MKSNPIKRRMVKYYLQLGYTIEGLELKKGSESVMDITVTMKRSLIRERLIQPCQHLSSQDAWESTTKTQKCYHCQEIRPIEQFSIQRNKVFLKTEQREVVREFRRTVCNPCRAKEHRAYILKSVLKDKTPNYQVI